MMTESDTKYCRAGKLRCEHHYIANSNKDNIDWDCCGKTVNHIKNYSRCPIPTEIIKIKNTECPECGSFWDGVYNHCSNPSCYLAGE